MVTQMGLQIGHQESGGNSFSGDVANDQAEAFAAEIEEVEIIAADVARLDAQSRIFKSCECRPSLGKKPALYLPGKFKLLVNAALGLISFGVRAALRLDFANDRVITEERERVAIQILEGGADRARRLRLWRRVETDAALAPFLELGKHVFG